MPRLPAMLLLFFLGLLAVLPGGSVALAQDYANASWGGAAGLDHYSVTFKPSSADLAPPQRNRIAEIARYWKRQNATGIRVVGYGETGLDSDASREVSRERAESVRDELRRNGIRPEYISTFWRGGYSPSDHSGIHEDDTRNCRADIEIVW